MSRIFDERMPTAGAPSVPAHGLIPTTTCAQARVRLYQATQRPTRREGEWQVTAWGRCRVSGRLGQRHADVVEAIMHHAERVQQMSDGAVYILVDPARVRRTISDAGYSGERLDALLTEILGAVIEIETEVARAMGHIIDEVVEASSAKRNPLSSSGAGTERSMMRVRIGAVMASLLKNDLHLRYNPAPIARLEHGVSQALARHVLTHTGEPRGGWRLDGLLDAVGVSADSQSMRNARRRLRQDGAGLEALGIAIEGDRVRRARVSHRPDGLLEQVPGVSHRPEGVPQRPEGVSQRPDFQTPYQDCQPFKADQARPVPGQARAGAA